MTIEIEMPDGSVAEFPDDMPQEQIQKAIRDHWAQQSKIGIQPEARQAAQREGVSAARGFMRGLQDVPTGLLQLSTELDPLKSLKNLLYSGLGEQIGLPLTAEQLGASIRGGEEAYQRERGTADVDVPRLAGNIIGGTALSLLGPSTAPSALGGVRGFLANRIRDAVTGGVLGAAQPAYGPDFRGEKMEQAGMGVAGGTLGGTLMAPFARVVAPRVPEDVQKLRELGVTPTIGQRLGGGASTMEQAMTSIPLAGSFVSGARKNTIEQFNRGIGERALGKVDPSLAAEMPKDIKAGHELIDYVGRTLSKQYNDLLPNLTGNIDAPMQQELQSIIQMATSSFPQERLDQFNRILKTQLFDRFTPQGNASGETLKTVESQLGHQVRGYMRSPDFDQQQLGSALREVQSSLRSMIERQNPNYAESLQPINKAWADFLRMENAAARGADGVFTPTQLRSASRSLDPSRKKSQFARGTALLQPEAEAAQRVLGTTLPSSGTSERAAAMGLLGVGAMTGIPAPALIGGAGLMGTYTAPGMKMADILMSGGAPTRERLLGGPLRRVASPIGAALLPFAPEATETVK